MWRGVDDDRCDLPPEGRLYLLWAILFNVAMLACAVMNVILQGA